MNNKRKILSLNVIFFLIFFSNINLSKNKFNPKGAKVFEDNCMACHKADGKGVVEGCPSIPGSKYLSNNDNYIKIFCLISNGHKWFDKSITEKYDYLMPIFKFELKEEEIFDVIEYITYKFGQEKVTFNKNTFSKVCKMPNK